MNNLKPEQTSKVVDWIQSKVSSEAVDVTAETELISQNLLNSIEFLELVTYIEDEFDIELDPDLLVPENFNTPLDIFRLIEQLQTGN